MKEKYMTAIKTNKCYTTTLHLKKFKPSFIIKMQTNNMEKLIMKTDISKQDESPTSPLIQTTAFTVEETEIQKDNSPEIILTLMDGVCLTMVSSSPLIHFSLSSGSWA